MSFKKKVIADWLSNFEGLKLIERYHSMEDSKAFKIILSPNIEWHVNLHINFIGKEWFIYYFNNFFALDRNYEVIENALGSFMVHKSNYKFNWLQTCTKKEYMNCGDLKNFFEFQQTQLRFQIEPCIFEDSGYFTMYYLGETFEIEPVEDVEAANKFVLDNLDNPEKMFNFVKIK